MSNTHPANVPVRTQGINLKERVSRRVTAVLNGIGHRGNKVGGVDSFYGAAAGCGAGGIPA
jgi:hypothetical protein